MVKSTNFSNKNDMMSAWRNFKNIFSRPLFTITFRPEMLKFHPYSILTGDTMVGLVIFCVLSTKHKCLKKGPTPKILVSEEYQSYCLCLKHIFYLYHFREVLKCSSTFLSRYKRTPFFCRHN